MRKLFTSESVTEGHPDKVCDQIADAILDEYLKQDKNARVACEVCCTTGLVFIFGEISSTAVVDEKKVAKEVIRNIGYTRAKYGFDADTCGIIVSLNTQSADIAMGVDNSLESSNSEDDYDKIGAGDQGMMFGYATNETEELIPLALSLSHKLTRKLSEVRKTNELSYLRPDGKAQVTIEYVDGKIKRVDTIVVSTQHSPAVTLEELKKDIREKVIDKVIPPHLIDNNTKFYINPTGRFEIGGPNGDSGLTGRKIIVDTYGGACPHGGGSFSGKDATKVDRSASYMARYICKNIVKSGLADICELQIAYAIGVAKPVSIAVNTHHTGKIQDEQIVEIIKNNFDLRPKAIIEKLKLNEPIFKNTASYGHFGNPDFPWEKLDMVDVLQNSIENLITLKR